MKWIQGLSVYASLVAVTAFAQVERRVGEQAPPGPSSPPGERSHQDRRSPGPPIDTGPRTPEANRAQRDGGDVLESAPGQPAPQPQPTPPAGPAGQQLPRP